jgi:2-dehydro-3-deoxygluconokinase
MKNVFFLGECMLELRQLTPNSMGQSFAGDVYNSAVYMKRCFDGINVGLITAVGQDALSDKMLATFNEAALDTDWVFRHPDKTVGAYLIETDKSGERSFVYWRSDSAAKQMMSLIDESALTQLSSESTLFFSGIPLAIFSPEARSAFWQTVARLKNKGVSIVFDPNYRSQLWENIETARAETDIALSLSDIVLPGVDDFSALYDIHAATDVIEYCQQQGAGEIIVKNGLNSVLTCVKGYIEAHSIIPAEKVIDTTSAGDAFNGVWLGARLSGHDMSHAVAMGAHAAKTVIQFPGAIAPEDGFADAMREMLADE